MDNGRGGAVLIACSNHLRCNPVILNVCEEIEYAAIKINTNNCGKLLFAVFYCPPSAPIAWLQGFIKMLSNCKYDKVLFVGDFNLPEITWIEGSGFCPSSESAVFMFCEELVNNLFQLIDSPTR